MKIAVAKSKWFMSSHTRSFEMLAKHVMSHYPKDARLHKMVRSSFMTSRDACARVEKSLKTGTRKTTPARTRATKRRTTARRKPARRRPTARKRTAARRTSRTRRAA